MELMLAMRRKEREKEFEEKQSLGKKIADVKEKLEEEVYPSSLSLLSHGRISSILLFWRRG
jgi:hypothetical protein